MQVIFVLLYPNFCHNSEIVVKACVVLSPGAGGGYELPGLSGCTLICTATR